MNYNNEFDQTETKKNKIVKRNSILRPDIHRQISELLDQDYNISPDDFLVNVDRINFEQINTKRNNQPINQIEMNQDIIPIKLNKNRIARYSDCQIQTDLSFKDIKVKNDIIPVYAEVQALGFFIMTEQERLDNLRQLINDEKPPYKYDPCIEFEKYAREVESGGYNRPRSTSSSRSRSRSTSKEVPMRTIATQTFYVSSMKDDLTKPDKHKSTQTTESSTTSSNESSPAHVTATTKTTIKKDPEQDTLNKIKENFSIKNKKETADLEYTQLSEYLTTINKVEKINSQLNIIKNEVDDKNVEDETNKFGKKLVHSTMEMTSVVNNKTTVTGISVKDSPEKFTIHIINPDGRIEEKPNLKSPPKTEDNLKNQEHKDEKLMTKKDDILPINLSNTKKAENLSLSTQLPPSVNFSEENYDINDRKSKLKPFIIKCDDDKVINYEDKGFESGSSANNSIRSSSGDNIPKKNPSNLINDLAKMYQIDNSKNQPVVPNQKKPTPNDISNNETKSLVIGNNPIRGLPPKSESEYSVSQLAKMFKPAIDSKDQVKPNPLTNKRSVENPILNSADMGLNSTTNKINNLQFVKKEAENLNQYSINQIPNIFKVNPNQNISLNKPQNNDVPLNNKSNKGGPTSFNNNISNPNVQANNQVKENIEFSIKDLPKMFKYEANIDQARTRPGSTKLELSDSLKKRLNQNEMMVLSNQNNQQRNQINDQTVKPRSVSANVNQRNIIPKTLKSIDLNENSDLIEIDFDSYDVPTYRQVVKEIEVPVEIPRSKSSSIDNINTIKKVSFSTDLNDPFKPEVRERRTSIKQTIPNANLEIDLSEYEQALNQRYVNTQQYLPNSRVKIQNEETNDFEFESDLDIPDYNLIQNLRDKFLLKEKINQDLEKNSKVKKEEDDEEEHYLVPIQYNNESPTDSDSNQDKKNQDLFPIKDKSRMRVFSQTPFKSNLDSSKNKGLTRSTEKLEIREYFPGELNNGVFETSGVDPVSKNNELDLEETKLDDSESNFDMNDSPKILTKMEQLIKSNVDKEYKKALRRINQRNERIPEIMKLLDNANSKETKHLYEELRLLMRKAKIDNELVKQYEKDNLSDLDDDVFDQNKVRLKKKRSHSSEMKDINELETDFESSSLVSFTNAKKYNKNKNIQVRIKNKKLLKDNFKSSNKTLESGYSSLEESLLDLKLSSQTDLEKEKSLFKEKNCNPNDLMNMMRQIDRNVAWSNETSKLNELSIERAIVEPLVEVDIAVDNDESYNNRVPRRRVNRPFNPNRNGNLNNYVSNNLPLRGNEVPLISNSGENLGSAAYSGRSAPLDQGSSQQNSSNPNQQNAPTNRSSESSGNVSRLNSNQNSATDTFTSVFRDTSQSSGQSGNLSNRSLRNPNDSENENDERKKKKNVQESAQNRQESNQANNQKSPAGSNRSADSSRPIQPNISRLINELNFNNNPNASSSFGARQQPTNQGSNQTTMPRQPSRDIEGFGSNTPSGRSSSISSSQQNFLSNRQNEPNSNNSSNESEEERRKKRNILDNRGNQNQSQDENSFNYVEEGEIKNLDLSKYQFYQDEDTGETIIRDLNTNQSFVILSENWRESESSYYFADEDIDYNSIEVYLDPKTNRRFIFNEETGKRYYLVAQNSIKKISTMAQNVPTQNKEPTEKIQDSDEVIRFKYGNETDSTNQEVEIDYAEENELANINLEDFAFYQDQTTGETLVINRANTNLRWIVIPNDWRTTNNIPYISEEDINSSNIDTYIDPTTKRKYVIDDQSGQRFFLIPKFRKDIRNFFSPNQGNQNARTSDSSNDKSSKQPGAVDIIKSSLKKPQSNDQKLKLNNESINDKVKLVFGDEQIQNLDNEPSNSKLRDSEMKSPIRKTHFDPNLLTSFKRPSALDNQNRFLIKQPGKPGHLIKDKNKPTDNNKQSDKKTPKSASGTKGSGSSKKPVSKDKEIALAKMKQDAARRAFFSQKLPNVGELWLHQLLIEEKNKEKQIDNLVKKYNSTEDLTSDSDSDAYLDKYGKPKAWRSLNSLNDPTIAKDSDSDSDKLDRQRLLDIQIYGYDKYDKSKKKRNIFDEDEIKRSKGRNYQPSVDPNNPSFGGFKNYPYVRGVLTEDFVESKEYKPVQLNSRYRALVPHTKLNLRQQFLTTPRYLKPTWDDVLSQSDQMQPKIIIINDDEVIITKNRNCNVYVQYTYENDAVLGADKTYQLMLPDRGPTNPARPLLISPGKLSKAMDLKLPKRPDLALREAPVYVYHQNGNAYFENIAQYLAGKQPQLSPKTARKILQFADLKEFEEYLASKLTRNEARRLATLSGENLINVDNVKKDLLNIIRDKKETNGEPLYYHKDCEYDSLRPVNINGVKDDDTKEYLVADKIMKSTFIGFSDEGEVKNVKNNDLPQNLMNIMTDVLKQDSKRN